MAQGGRPETADAPIHLIAAKRSIRSGSDQILDHESFPASPSQRLRQHIVEWAQTQQGVENAAVPDNRAWVP